jgi:hypothetical protein
MCYDDADDNDAVGELWSCRYSSEHKKKMEKSSQRSQGGGWNVRIAGSQREMIGIPAHSLPNADCRLLQTPINACASFRWFELVY